MFTVRTAILIILCFKTSVSLVPNISPDSCLKQILSELVKDVDSLEIIWSHRIDGSIKDEISKVFGDKIITITNRQSDGRTIATVDGKPGALVIVASTKADIASEISSMSNRNALNSVSKFVVVYLDESGNGNKSLTDPFLIDVSQALGHFNVHITYKIDNEIHAFSSFHMGESNCHTIERVRLNREFAMYENYVKLPMQMFNTNSLGNRTTITAAVHSIEPYSFYSKDTGFSKGVEIDLVKELARWLHFNLELKAIDNINSTNRAEVDGRNFDIIIGASSELRKQLTESIDFHFDYLTWCVKKASLIRPWRSFFLVGTWQVWTIAVIAVYAVGATLFAFYTHYHHPENYHYCTGITMLTLFAVPVPYNPTHGIARIHFGFLLMYGLLAVIAINCYLTSMMTKPHYQYQISTIDDLMHYKYKILVDMDVVPLSYLGNDKISSYTKANNERCNDMIHCLNELFRRSKVAAIVPRKLAQHFESTTKLPIFCFADSESFNKNTRAFNLGRSNARLQKEMNLFIRRAMETGHLIKWESISTGNRKHENNWDGPVALSVEHLSGALLIYTVAITLAILCFIGERLTHQNIKNKNNCTWKWLDKLFLSTERLIWIKKNNCPNEVEVEVED